MHPTGLRIAKWLFLGTGFLILGYVAGVMAYGEIFQRYQSRRFEETIRVSEFIDGEIAARGTPLREGDLIGKLEIPRLDVSVMVLEGVDSGTLRIAAGHVPGTSLPGEDGNSAIAAHRDTFFRNLRGIRSGDRIQVVTLRGTYLYIVDTTEIVGPEDTPVLAPKGYPVLTLITCYPFSFIGPAPKRFIVYARRSDFLL